MSVESSDQPGREIERKFLVPNPPNLSESLSVFPIKQGYLSVGSGGAETRLRRIGDRYFLTYKEGMGLSRLETEIDLTKQQFEALWPHTKGRRLEKDRHEIPYSSHVIQVDVFHGPLEGLVVAEVEFESIEASRQFEPPAWLGEEVTEDERYKNKILAIDGIPGTPI